MGIAVDKVYSFFVLYLKMWKVAAFMKQKYHRFDDIEVYTHLKSFLHKNNQQHH